MATVSRSTLMARIISAIGGYAGSITSGTATTAVLAGLVGVLNDDELNDWLLVMPDATASGDQQRIVSDWTGATGTATFAARVTDTTFTSETYCLIPKNTYTLQEVRDMISKAMRETKRTYRCVVPSNDFERQYPLTALSWLRNAKDVDGVYWRPSPGLLDNEDFSRWQNGSALAPDSWTLAGSGGTVLRTTSFSSRGPYAAQLTRVGTDVTLTQTVPYALARRLIDLRATVAISVACEATVASRAYVGINDGSGVQYSSAHTGGGTTEKLTNSITLSATSTGLSFVCAVRTGNTDVIFDAVYAVEDSAVQESLSNQGSSGYLEQEVPYQLWNVGSGVPILALQSDWGRRGQFLVASRRPFADFSSDADVTEAESELIESRAIFELASLRKPGMDRALPDRLMKEHGQKFTELAAGQIDRPLQPAMAQLWTRGA